jgi:hypothetical protein
MPGGSNNDSDIWYGGAIASAAQAQEIEERNGAGLRWLDTAFKRARQERDSAVVIMVQAERWDLDSKQLTDNHLNQYKQFLGRQYAANFCPRLAKLDDLPFEGEVWQSYCRIAAGYLSHICRRLSVHC